MKKHVFYTLAVAALLGACSQDDFQTPVEIVGGNAGNGFEQYVGVPFEGDINFSKGDDADTRMGLNDELGWKWEKDDQVGLVWTNSGAISTALAAYDTKYESAEVKARIAKDYKLDPADLSAYVKGVQNGTYIPYDDSYVWNEWPTNWQTYSNTRMTYDGTKWHMTDGQVYKGVYLAYYPFDATRQATSKFTVMQDAVQKQNATTYASNAEAKNTISNHILSTVPGEGMVWISQNDGEANQEGSTQHSSFLYTLAEQDTESGTSQKVNIKMRPFSDILDLRIKIENNDSKVDATVAKEIRIKDVTLMAKDVSNKPADVLPTTASFNMSQWGSATVRNGVYGMPSQLDGPYYYTWQVAGDQALKYAPADMVSEFTNDIQNEAANNGVEQRVQIMLLPWNTASQTDALAYTTNFWVRVNTDYGYVDIAEDYWTYSKPADSGLIVNPDGTPGPNCVQPNSTKSLAYALSYIGQRATRYINFNASQLNYNNVDVCSTEDLITAIAKWNALGKKNGTFRVYQTSADCTFDNLIWNNTADQVVVKTQQLAAANQPDGEDLVLGSANDVILTFLANGNTLKVNSKATYVNLGGNSAIAGATDKIVFEKPVMLKSEGKLGITTNVTLKQGLNTEDGSALYVSNSAAAQLTLGDNEDATTGSSTWYGDLYLYQAGNILLDRYTTVTNYGDMHINGHFLLNGAANLNNNIDPVTNAEGHVYLYAYADLNGSPAVGGVNVTKFTNNSTIHYVDMLRETAGFWNSNVAKLTYTNNKTVIAEITDENQANHAAAYLNKANEFGANVLLISNATISQGEWNNLGTLDSFEKVQLTNTTWNIFKAVSMPNAICYINDEVEIIGNNQEAKIAVEQFVLNASSTLTATNIPVQESELTVMYNNTTLKGYEQFSKNSEQPTFIGDKNHTVLNSDGERLFE